MGTPLRRGFLLIQIKKMQGSLCLQERQEQRKARLEERSRYTPGQLRAQFWGGILAVVIVLVLLFN